MEKLASLEFVGNLYLNNIEKLAFKNMKRIRLIRFDGNPQLTDLEKGSFSSIGNKNGLKILFDNTPIHRIHSGAFRNAEKIRELSISGSDLALSRHCFSNMNQLDFLTVSGVALAEPELFTNSTRIYIIHFKNGHFDIPPNLFGGLSHVHHIFLENNIIGTIAPDAFTGLETIEFVELYSNRIESVKARAFTGIINLGKLKLLRNSVSELDTSEAILSIAFDTQIEGNTLDCECNLKWMTAIDPISDTNYCDASGAHRSVRSFLSRKCAPTRKVDAPRRSSSSSKFFLIFILCLLEAHF